MPDSPDEDADSRTASLGVQRGRNNPCSLASSRHASHDSSNPRPTKKLRRNGPGDRDLGDFVPRGATFSANSLQVDPESTSSPGSSLDSSKDDSHSENLGTRGDAAPANPHVGSTAPAISWNQGRKSAVRTSLGKRSAQSDGNSAGQFKAVNGKYWRSRSASVSSGDTDVAMEDQAQGDDRLDDGEIDRSDSEDFDSLDSEADDSLMLNIGTRNEKGPSADAGDDYDPESLIVKPSHTNGETSGPLLDSDAAQLAPPSKEEAFQQLSQKYPTAPTTLVDLHKSDLVIQAKYLFFDRDINELDLSLPITCIECLRDGHLADVCPTKECVHCGAWNQHQSTLCPRWRRCQRCRERGHDGRQCSSLLKSSASEIPCDLCGSSSHLELQCDYMWKFPSRDQSSKTISVSVSCAHCASSKHLVGDCPSLRPPITTSSFTIKGLDPNMIVDLNSVVGPKRGGPAKKGQRGIGARGRGGRSPSPDSDDMMPRRRPPPTTYRGSGRGNIRIGSGIGVNRNLVGPDRPRNNVPPPSSRGRAQYPGNNTRQRSLSPIPHLARGGGRGRAQYPGNTTRQRSLSPNPQPARGGRGGGRGRGAPRGGRGRRARP